MANIADVDITKHKGWNITVSWTIDGNRKCVDGILNMAGPNYIGVKIMYDNPRPGESRGTYVSIPRDCITGLTLFQA